MNEMFTFCILYSHSLAFYIWLTVCHFGYKVCNSSRTKKPFSLLPVACCCHRRSRQPRALNQNVEAECDYSTARLSGGLSVYLTGCPAVQAAKLLCHICKFSLHIFISCASCFFAAVAVVAVLLVALSH